MRIPWSQRWTRTLIFSTLLLNSGGYFIFYTDAHDVDEDENTIPSQGGEHARTNDAGVFIRQPDNPLNITHTVVASMCSFNYEYAYIITLIVNELIEDNSVRESIVH